MLQGLAGERENQVLKVNKLKTKAVMEKTAIYVYIIQDVESYVYMGQKNNYNEKKPRRFKEELRPGG